MSVTIPVPLAVGRLTCGLVPTRIHMCCTKPRQSHSLSATLACLQSHDVIVLNTTEILVQLNLAQYFLYSTLVKVLLLFDVESLGPRGFSPLSPSLSRSNLQGWSLTNSAVINVPQRSQSVHALCHQGQVYQSVQHRSRSHTGVSDLWALAQAGTIAQYIWHSAAQVAFMEANRSTKVILYC